MGKIILNLKNLKTYGSAGYSKNKKLPDWRLADMLHVRLPVVAYRDYANDYDDKDWPFCWQSEREIIAALRITVPMLKAWQATRRPGGAKLILKRLERRQFPRIIRRLQKVLRTHSAQWFNPE